jgi:hypothetical protein
MISSSVTPLARFIMAITSAFLFVRASAAPFCSPCALWPSSWERAPWRFPWPYGAVLLAGPFFKAGFGGATCAACSAAVAALSLVSVFVMRIVLFCAGFGHDDSSLQLDRDCKSNLQRLWARPT